MTSLTLNKFSNLFLCAAVISSAVYGKDIVTTHTPPIIRHVFTIVLENEGYGKTFSPDSPAPYLSKTLVGKGILLKQFYGIGHFSLGNYVAMISGQAPNPETQSDCQKYTDFISTGTTTDGQAVGSGCVYPSNVTTLADQLTGKGLTWKSYNEDMGKDISREGPACGHPEIGTVDRTQKATLGDQYAARHNPFVYFHSIIDSPACQQNVVNLDGLDRDLKSIRTTPNYIFITPNLCHDGHDAPCVNGEPGGLKSADLFLKHWVPKILSSPAFKKDGVLIITFDEGEISGKFDNEKQTFTFTGDASACCDEQPGPNIGAPGQTVFNKPSSGPGVIGPGGGITGEVLISRFIKPGTVSNQPYNHYSQLKSIEDIFGLTYLGYAGQPRLKGFSSDVFNNR